VAKNTDLFSQLLLNPQTHKMLKACKMIQRE